MAIFVQCGHVHFSQWLFICGHLMLFTRPRNGITLKSAYSAISAIDQVGTSGGLSQHFNQVRG